MQHEQPYKKSQVGRQYQGKSGRFLCLNDPLQVARMSWSLLINNPIKKTSYLMMCILDLFFILYYSFNLVERIHIQNELNLLIQEKRDYIFYATCIILGIFLILCITLIILTWKADKLHKGKEQNLFKSILCAILITMHSCLFMPLIDVILRNILETISSVEKQSQVYLFISYIVSALAIIFLLILCFYGVRVLNVSVPTPKIPWCSPISQITYLNMLIRILLVVSSTIDQKGQSTIVEVIIIFILQLSQGMYRVFFASNYERSVDIMMKAKDFMGCLILLIGMISKALSDNKNFELIYFILFTPLVNIAWVLLERHRKGVMLYKIKNRELKLEIENEYALYLIMTLVRDSMGEDIASQNMFGKLIDIMMTHIEECDDSLCICDQVENFYELLKLKHRHNQEVFPLLREERKQFKKILDDEGLIGTISNITDLNTLVNQSSMNSSQEQQQQENEAEQQYLNKKSDFGTVEVAADKKDKKPRRPIKIYKVNIDETKHKFLSEVLYIFYFQIIQRYPDSLKINLLANFFFLHYKQKEMLCVFQMRSFNTAKLSYLDKISHSINEQYLLWDVERVQKMKRENDNLNSTRKVSEGNFDGEYFIKMNQLYREFDDTIEELCFTVVNFWNQFTRPSLDVELTQVVGMKIALGIQDAFFVFSQLDSLKQLKDYNMYFKFAIVQLHILNDPSAYELYIGKMKSILDINKVYEKNFSNANKSSDYSNFIIVDANGSKFGQVLQSNASMRAMLGWSEEEAKRQRIENFMPQLIQQKHNSFMRRFNQTGLSYIINKKATMFIKKANGFVIPVELYIKFHYSTDYRYTFLAILNPFHEMAPFKNKVKYNINQLFFLIVEDEVEGRITECSQSLPTILKDSFQIKSKYGGNSQSTISRRITEVVSDLDFVWIKQTREERYQNGEIYENIHQIDILQIAGEEYNNNSNDNNLMMPARTRVFEERFSGGILDMNIFCFLILNDTDYYTNSVVSGSLSPAITQVKSNHFQNLNLQRNLHSVVQDEQTLKPDIDNEDNIGNEQSQTGSSNNSSMGSSASTQEFRSFHSFAKQHTPKSLTLMIRLIICLYLIMISIATVNLGIIISRQVLSANDVHVFKLSYDRMAQVSRNQLTFRALLNMANGLEPNTTELASNRYDMYLNMSRTLIQKLQVTQSALQQSKTFQKSADFQEFENGQNSPLYYLKEDQSVVQENENLNIAFNLYISKMNELSTTSSLVGNTSLMKLQPKPKPYKPTTLEQNVYFVNQNALLTIRRGTIDTCHYYAWESEKHAQQHIFSTMILVVVSIISLFGIGLAIAPILTKAETRKYLALQYFLRIPKDRLQILISNCEYCENMDEEDRFFEIQRDYESFLGIKLINQRLDQIRKERDIQNNIIAQSSNDGGSTGQSDTLPSSWGNQNNKTFSKASSHKTPKSIKKSPNQVKSSEVFLISRQEVSIDIIDDANHNQESSLDINYLQVMAQQNNLAKNQINIKNSAVEDDEVDMTQNQKLKKNKLILANLNHKFNSVKNKKISRQKSSIKQHKSEVSIKKEESQDGDKVDEESNQEDPQTTIEQDYKLKYQQILTSSNRRKYRLIFAALLIVGVFSLYYIIAYFLSMRIFNSAVSVVESLQLIFLKGACFDQTMNFLREAQITNTTTLVKNPENIAFKNGAMNNDWHESITEYLDYCLRQETMYQEMRIEKPAQYQQAQAFMDQIESSTLCKTTEVFPTQELQNQCETALNGIMSKGFSNTFSYMYTQIIKSDQDMKNMDLNKNRTLQKAQNFISSKMLVDVIDVKSILLNLVIDRLKINCMESVIAHIKSLLMDFVVAYIIFTILISLTIVFMIYWSLKFIKRNMWNTNIILKILPFETLSRDDREMIKEFFKQ